MNNYHQLLIEGLDIFTLALNESGINRGRQSSQESGDYGVNKLRQLVLDLAVQGRLSEQLESDEPSYKLLQRVFVKKSEYSSRKSIKTKSDVASKVFDMPFELPNSWAWASLADIGWTQTGSTPSKNDPSMFGSDIPFIKPGDIYKNYVNYSNEGLSTEGAKTSSRIARSGSLLMVCIGTIGKCNLIENDCAFNQQINSLTPCLINSEYLLLALRSNYFQKSAWARSSSTTIPILNKGKWEKILIPIPPLAEQQRIVDTVSELMHLFDGLSSQVVSYTGIHKVLVEEFLKKLRLSNSLGEFKANRDSILENFEVLFNTEESVEVLRLEFLQLAVMGRLVTQNIQDDPVISTINRFNIEKLLLKKQGKLKSAKGIELIPKEEVPFEIPESWTWVRLKDIVYLLGDGLHGTPVYTPNGEYFFVNGNNLQDGKIVIKNGTKAVSAEEASKHKKDLNDRTIFVSINGTIGNVAFYNNEKIILGKSACYFNLGHEFSKEYLKLVFDSPYFLNYAKKAVSGTTIMNLSLFSMNNFPIPLPPIAEQTRIVEKVNEISVICEQLKLQIGASNVLRRKLADALVEQALA